MISEKTLELNITHEILALGNQLDYLVQAAVALPWFVPPHDWWWWQRFGGRHPRFATGLSLSDENRRGWDVQIRFEAAANEPAHALFLQFKAGKHRSYSKSIGSAFHGSRRDRAPFCQFGLNNNGDKNQHVVLRSLAAQPRLGGAVAYAFPRIPNAATFKACLGRLLHVTSFVSVDELDDLAGKEGITINVGHEHKYNTSYTFPLVEEVCSDPSEIDSSSDLAGVFFGDVLACRIHGTLKKTQKQARKSSEFMSSMSLNMGDLFRLFVMEVASYLAIPHEHFAKRLETDLVPAETEMLTGALRAHEVFANAYLQTIDHLPLSNGGLRSEFGRTAIFDEVIERLAPLMRFASSSNWVESDLPDLKTKKAVELPADGLVVKLDDMLEFMSHEQIDRALRHVSYQAF